MSGVPFEVRIINVALDASAHVLELQVPPNGFLNKLRLRLLGGATDAFEARLFTRDPDLATALTTDDLQFPYLVLPTVTAVSGVVNLTQLNYGYGTELDSTDVALRQPRKLWLRLSAYAATPSISGSIVVVSSRGMA